MNARRNDLQILTIEHGGSRADGGQWLQNPGRNLAELAFIWNNYAGIHPDARFVRSHLNDRGHHATT